MINPLGDFLLIFAFYVKTINKENKREQKKGFLRHINNVTEKLHFSLSDTLYYPSLVG